MQSIGQSSTLRPSCRRDAGRRCRWSGLPEAAWDLADSALSEPGSGHKGGCQVALAHVSVR